MAVVRSLVTLVAFTSLLWLALHAVGVNLPYVTDALLKVPYDPIITALVVAVVSGLTAFKLYRMELMQDGAVKSSLEKTSLAAASGWFAGRQDVSEQAQQYWDLHSDKSKDTSVEARKGNYMGMVNSYYDLVTDFYEYGWGKSFHFGRRFAGEDHVASLARHEHWLAMRAGFREGHTILDLGCGVGGPMRAIARFTGAKIIGVNNNDYQIRRGTIQNQEAGLADLCSFAKNDFMKMKFRNNFADGAYTIEAACHSPDKVNFFREVKRVLKPGAVFVGYEWCLTDKYDPDNADHRRIKKNIEEGDGLPDLWTCDEVVEDLQAAGFEVIEAFDVSPVDERNSVPWYDVIDGKWSLSNFRVSKTGVSLTHAMVWTMELLRLAPKGTTLAHDFLTKALPGLRDGGKSGTFTPMFYFKVRKPLDDHSDVVVPAHVAAAQSEDEAGEAEAYARLGQEEDFEEDEELDADEADDQEDEE